MPTDLASGIDRALLESLSSFVDQFDEELRSGKNPHIEHYLETCTKHCAGEDARTTAGETPAVQSKQAALQPAVLFGHLFAVELEFRARYGERPTLQEYQKRFPQYLEVVAKEFPAEIGNYDLLELRGLGAYGRVYRGRLKGTGICHAVKILYRARDFAEIDAAQAEFEALVRLRDRAIVAAHYLDIQHEQTPYITMEYVDGKSLQEMLAAGRLSIPQVVRLVYEVAEALAVAHSAGIIHRDLKPSNIMVDSEGRAHVTDFGLALLSTDRRIRKEELAGTLAYVSPEHIRAESLDPRADIWSLGVIFYEALTGERPFDGATKEDLFDQIQTANATRPQILRPDVPRRLERICLKCLEKDRDQRWGTGHDLAKALRRKYRSDIVAREFSVAGASSASSSKLLWRGALAIVLVLAALVGIKSLYSYVHLRSTSGAENQMSPANPTFISKGIDKVTWTDPATGLIWATHDSGNGKDWDETNDLNASKALQYCRQLRLDDYLDWRLAGIDELEKLYDQKSTASYVYDAKNYEYHIKGGITLTGWPWSATANGTQEVWGFDFHQGTRFTYRQMTHAGTRALCVRGNRDTLPTIALAATKDLVWTDPASGLMWTKRDNGTDINWPKANDYCGSQRLGDYLNWRLPTLGELQQIYDPGAKIAFFRYDEENYFYYIKGGITLTGWPWSGTNNAPTEAWYVKLDGNSMWSNPVNSRVNKRALCVRRVTD